MDSTFIQTMIDSIKAEITALSTAILALTVKTQKEYIMDTGQGRIRVTRVDLQDLIKSRDILIEQLSYWCNQLTGAGSRTQVPSW
jgi:hypothetical protein